MNKLIKKYKVLPTGVKASLWFLFASFFQSGISVISTPIFTRLLSTSEYGQYNVFQSWLNIMTVFVSLKLYAGVFSAGVVKFEEDRKRFAAALQGLCLTIVAVWIIIYLIFQNVFNELFSLTTIQSLAMFLLIWTTSIFSFWAVEQRTDNKYVQLVAVTTLVSLLKPIVGIILVISADDKVTARILGLVAVEFIVYISLFAGDIIGGKTFFDKSYWKYALSFNIPLIPHYLSTSILSSADRIMIEKMVGESEAGIYSLAYSISMIMVLFNSALLQTLEPWIYKKIKYKATDDISRVSYIALVLIAGVNIFLIAFAPEAVRIFAPEEYYQAIWVIPPVAMSVYFMFAYCMFAEFEFYFEKKKYISISTVCGAVANIVLNYIFIMRHGYIAAGYTTLFCYAIYAMLHFLAMRAVCKNEIKREVFDIKIIALITSVFLVLGTILLMSYANNYVRYSMLIAGFIILFLFRENVKDLVSMVLAVKKEGRS